MNMCGCHTSRSQNHTLFQTEKAKSITLFQIKTAPKPYTYSLYIGVPPTVDLWVIGIKKSLWSFARVVRRNHVNRTRNGRSRGENMRKVCLFHGQNNKIWGIHKLRKGLWAFFLDCAFRRRQTFDGSAIGSVCDDPGQWRIVCLHNNMDARALPKNDTLDWKPKIMATTRFWSDLKLTANYNCCGMPFHVTSTKK